MLYNLYDEQGGSAAWNRRTKMEDWFNKRDGSSRNESERKVGRIFDDDAGTDEFGFSGRYSNAYGSQRNSEYDLDESYGETSARYSSSRRESGTYSDGFRTGELDLDAIRAQLNSSQQHTESYHAGDFEDIESTPSRGTKRKKPKGKKIFFSILAILLVVAIAVGGYAYTLFSKVNYTPDEHKANEYISSSDLYSDDDVYNILLIGTDERATQANYRSDTMILVSLDKNTKKIKLTSFLRDMWVYIPGKDKSAKLNAACSYGGPQMVIDTLEYHFKVKIDKYVMINFDVFKTVINDLGGITLTITEAEAANITKEAGFNCKAGTRTVKGRTALWYARIRHLDSDFNRTARQRKVIQAVIDKAKESDIKTLATVLNDVLPEIQTDINKNEMAKLGVNALLKYIKYDIEEQQIPAKGTWSNAWVGSQQVLKADLDDNAKILKEFIYETK